jgi:hypothetical protein
MRDKRVDTYLEGAPAWQRESGHGNETGRMIAIYRDQPINQPAMIEPFRAIIANNRAGGWRQLKKG